MVKVFGKEALKIMFMLGIGNRIEQRDMVLILGLMVKIDNSIKNCCR